MRFMWTYWIQIGFGVALVLFGSRAMLTGVLKDPENGEFYDGQARLWGGFSIALGIVFIAGRVMDWPLASQIFHLFLM